MTMEQLPPKGVKREQAILELGKEEANGELLLQLVNTEKGKCKTAAQKALAQLEYDPAAPLWAKLVKAKWMGSNIMSDTCSDCVSQQIAPIILKTLFHLLDEADTKPLNQEQVEQLRFCIALMLGKASPKMLEVYRFLAENTERIAKLEHTPFYDGDDCTCWRITDGLQLWNANPTEMEKIPAVVLTASLIHYPSGCRLLFPGTMFLSPACVSSTCVGKRMATSPRFSPTLSISIWRKCEKQKISHLS